MEKLTLAEIIGILEASLLAGEDGLDMEFKKCGASDLMSDILAKVAEGSILLTGLANVQAVRTAVISGAGAVVFVRGKTPPADVIEAALMENVPILSTPLSMFVSCGRLHARGLMGLDGNR